jgi:hypothetical protein
MCSSNGYPSNLTVAESVGPVVPVWRVQRYTVMASEPAHMHFINDRLGEWPAKQRILLPVVTARIDNHALQCGGSVVARFLRYLPASSPGTGDAFAIGIEQEFVGVKTQSLLRIEETFNP